ncbi:MAG: PQQ-binding-like beta-propeller repeat protein, partial [Thermoanaerobaculia bacterium]|nr:PQQ-binding-like beta-propeller repeat protein [Thermoanaerobaculia bacterium]
HPTAPASAPVLRCTGPPPNAMLKIAAFIAALLTAITVVAAEPWPRFRGLHAGVAADHPSLPEAWSRTENVVWAVEVPGLAWSSPIVWGDTVFVTTAESGGDEPEPQPGLYDPGDDFGKKPAAAVHRFAVLAYDVATGGLRWRRDLATVAPPELKHIKNSFASETPVTDGDRLYVYFGSIGLLAALDLAGETVWSVDLGAFNGRQEFGTAASPALHEDRVYVVNDNRETSFLAAFDAATGRELWRVERDEVESWSTPFVWENELRTEIVTAGWRKIRSYDLEGQELWSLGPMTLNVTPTPFSAHGLVYLSSGYPGGHPRPVYAVRPGATGDISLAEGESRNEHVAWFQPRLGTYNTSAIVVGDIYYTLLDRGFLLAHDARTGEEIYGRQRIARGHGFTASPWSYNGRLFLLSEEGTTYAVPLGGKFEVVATSPLDELTLATPAVAGDSLFLRTRSRLYRISAGAGE